MLVRRLVAALIDGVVVVFLYGVLWLVFFVLIRVTHSVLPDFIVFIPQLCLPWIYFAGLESSADRATAGKWLLGLVVSDREGRRASFARTSVRYCAKAVPPFIGLAVLYLMVAGMRWESPSAAVAWIALLIGVGMILWPRDGRMYWDTLSGCCVTPGRVERSGPAVSEHN